MKSPEDILGYQFTNHTWLEKALTHPSCGKVVGGRTFNYQRLEFLGDSVLGLVVAKLLFNTYRLESEGDLARRLAALVRGETIHKVAVKLNLRDYLILSNSEEISGGRNNPANLENCCEALIGAIYLDGGLEPAEKFILTHWKELADSLTTPPKDSKTALQEWAQSRALPLPVYATLHQDGPSHAPTFTCEVRVDTLPPASAAGPSKRVAEQQAAEQLLVYIRKHYAAEI